jgi:hypothetical protein
MAPRARFDPAHFLLQSPAVIAWILPSWHGLEEPRKMPVRSPRPLTAFLWTFPLPLPRHDDIRNAMLREISTHPRLHVLVC